MSQLCKQGPWPVLGLVQVFSGWKLGRRLQAGELYWWGQHPTPRSFTRAWDLLSTGKGRGAARAASARAVIPYPPSYLVPVAVWQGELSILIKRYDPVLQKSGHCSSKQPLKLTVGLQLPLRKAMKQLGSDMLLLQKGDLPFPMPREEPLQPPGSAQALAHLRSLCSAQGWALVSWLPPMPSTNNRRA